jgi:hypothetical protein
MPFTGNEDHEITLAVAAAMTKRYRDTLPAQGGVLGHYIGKGVIEDILAQSNCVGVRIYYALDENNKKQLVVTGVKADQDDLYQGILADKTLLCPTFCATDNPLNSDVTP